MIAVETSGISGVEACFARVTTSVGGSSPGLDIIGLPESQARETRVRVRAALAGIGVDLGRGSGAGLGAGRTVVVDSGSPQPAGSFDLAIAVSVLSSMDPDGKLDERIAGVLFLGELSLSGQVLPSRGVLPRLRGAARGGVKKAIVPWENGAEAAHAEAAHAESEGIEVFLARDLAEVRAWLHGENLHRVLPASVQAPVSTVYDPDMAEVIGMPQARLALEVAAAGGHHLLLSGPPGSGKVMLARRLPGILPAMTREESIEATEVHSVAGLIGAGQGLVTLRPFRAPHYTVSEAGLFGGGEHPRPGEISLAHQGVLLLDELPEFRRSMLEGLVTPVRDGEIKMVRRTRETVLPCRTLLVGAMNPCPCGFYGSSLGRPCGCSDERVTAYRERLSAVRSVFDLTVNLDRLETRAVMGSPAGESSATVRERVTRARAMQAARFAAGDALVPLNSRLFGGADHGAEGGADGLKPLGLYKVLASTSIPEGFTAKMLRVARTVADLDGVEEVTAAHVEAAYRLRGMP